LIVNRQKAYVRFVAHRRMMRRNRGGRSLVPLALGLLTAPLLVAVCLGGGTYFAASSFVRGLDDYPSAAEAVAANGGGARIYDRHGTLLFQFLDEGYGQQTRVPLEDTSFWIRAATIATEDESFYQNPGISISGIGRAALDNLQPGDEFLQGRGGSSITQQLVKQIYFTPEEREQRSVERKLTEAVLAIRMTDEYEKDQILEWYLNEIPYGNNAIGIEAASLGYFGVHARDLTLAQSAFLAGLPQSPSMFDPFTSMDAAKARQAEVLGLMERHGAIDATMHSWALLEEIVLNPAPVPFLAPHFVLYAADYLRATLGEEALYHGGLSVLTTLDLALNDAANATLEQHLQSYEASAKGHNGSVVVIQPATGQVLAMVGSRNYFRGDIHGEVNNAVALNSPGSTLKPFTYATALMQGWSPEWPIVDTAITYEEPDGSKFSPRNPDGRTRGVIPMKQALGNSFNIPAFKTILWVGVDNVRRTAQRMGITTLGPQLGPALTLGGADITLLDLTYAYSTFANNGIIAGVSSPYASNEGNRTIDPNPILLVKNKRGEILMNNTVPASEKAIEPEYAYMITDILSTDENRQITYGRGSNLNIPGRRVAVKTGTSEPYADNKKLIGDTWTVGYTPDIAVGVWVGNSDNSPMVNISSTTIAGRTWHDVMVRANEGLPRRDWTKPAGIVRATVCVPSGVVKQRNDRCPSVTGDFVIYALGEQTDRWWGGVELPRPRTAEDLTRAPRELTDWKSKLATEYFRRVR
jgi:membrane peptidoglycan carboxypeptidase